MQIHGDDMVAASGLEHVGHESCSDGCARLVLLVLTCIREVGKDCSDATGRGSLAGVDHDQELHDSVVDVSWCGGLKDEYCVRPSMSDARSR